MREERRLAWSQMEIGHRRVDGYILHGILQHTRHFLASSHRNDSLVMASLRHHLNTKRRRPKAGRGSDARRRTGNGNGRIDHGTDSDALDLPGVTGLQASCSVSPTRNYILKFQHPPWTGCHLDCGQDAMRVTLGTTKVKKRRGSASGQDCREKSSSFANTISEEFPQTSHAEKCDRALDELFKHLSFKKLRVEAGLEAGQIS